MFQKRAGVFQIRRKVFQKATEFKVFGTKLIFHVINVKSQILNQYEILFISKNKENWKDDVVDNKNGFIISNTIVINTKLNKQMVNEIGIIGIENNNGGVYRVC